MGLYLLVNSYKECFVKDLSRVIVNSHEVKYSDFFGIPKDSSLTERWTGENRKSLGFVGLYQEQRRVRIKTLLMINSIGYIRYKIFISIYVDSNSK